jgi:hypothetical protein
LPPRNEFDQFLEYARDQWYRWERDHPGRHEQIWDALIEERTCKWKAADIKARTIDPPELEEWTRPALNELASKLIAKHGEPDRLPAAQKALLYAEWEPGRDAIIDEQRTGWHLLNPVAERDPAEVAADGWEIETLTAAEAIDEDLSDELLNRVYEIITSQPLEDVMGELINLFEAGVYLGIVRGAVARLRAERRIYADGTEAPSGDDFWNDADAGKPLLEWYDGAFGLLPKYADGGSLLMIGPTQSYKSTIMAASCAHALQANPDLHISYWMPESEGPEAMRNVLTGPLRASSST